MGPLWRWISARHLLLEGGRTLVELMYGDFIGRAGDEIFNRMNAEIDEADPEYGFFSPHSWWPIAVAAAAGAVTGALLQSRVPTLVLQRGFGVLLLMVAGYESLVVLSVTS